MARLNRITDPAIPRDPNQDMPCACGHEKNNHYMGQTWPRTTRPERCLHVHVSGWPCSCSRYTAIRVLRMVRTIQCWSCKDRYYYKCDWWTFMEDGQRRILCHGCYKKVGRAVKANILSPKKIHEYM